MISSGIPHIMRDSLHMTVNTGVYPDGSFLFGVFQKTRVLVGAPLGPLAFLRPALVHMYTGK